MQPPSFRSLTRAPLGLGLLLASFVFVIGCGSQQKKADNSSKVVVDNEDEFEDDGVEMMQEFGGMSEDKVTKAFKRVQKDLVACLGVEGPSSEYLGGQVAFLVTVDRSGRTLAAQMERSDLGSYSVERCMLDILAKNHWPKPVGGHKGLARSGMEYDSGAVRPPVQWEVSDIESTLTSSKNAEILAACGGGGPFEITAYVATSGKVLSAGIAHTDDDGEKTAACLVAAVEEMRFPSPGSWPAKISFQR